jgi:hypothetical protein
MTEMVTSGSMSGEGKRSDGLLGESGNERRRSHLAPPVLHATVLLFDSTGQKYSLRPYKRRGPYTPPCKGHSMRTRTSIRTHRATR